MWRGRSSVTVEDIMTRQVITVRPDATVQDAARLMFTNRVSGLPVVDADGRVVGVISDGDLIQRQRRPKAKPWWHLFFENGERLLREYRKIVGLTVGDVMTHPALVISPVFGIETAAAILHNRQIRRLPVVRDGQLVGIVSRGDLVKALAATDKSASGGGQDTAKDRLSTGGRTRRGRTRRP
jgi:CBS domain-containing protein